MEVRRGLRGRGVCVSGVRDFSSRKLELMSQILTEWSEEAVARRLQSGEITHLVMYVECACSFCSGSNLVERSSGEPVTYTDGRG